MDQGTSVSHTMPSFSDSAVIFLLALLLFGPKRLPELARYLGKLMSEFRRASAEFRMQMDDEFRSMEQAEQQKKIAAIEAAAPAAPLNIPEPEHPHMPAPIAVSEPVAEPEMVTANLIPEDQIDTRLADHFPAGQAPATPVPTPVPIASNGDLHMHVPATGLPIGRSVGSSSVASAFDAIPHAPAPASAPATDPEASTHA